MSSSKLNPGHPHPGIQNLHTDEPKPQSQMTSEICSEFTKRTDVSLKKGAELYERAADAREAMELLATTWKASWLEFQTTGDTRIKEFRLFRMAMDSELGKLMSGLRDVRTFFMDKDYETEVSRLREFVSLCERLQKLKESGFLDTIADTMLKLSDGK